VRIGLGVAMFLTVIAVIGTYSRGGVISLVVMGSYFWYQSKQKVFIALFAVIVVIVGIKVMPEEWTARMNSIGSAEEDQSFQGRVQAWHFALNVAAARPLVGAGFSGTEQGRIFGQYLDDPTVTHGRAAHSIYFQVLGDHGYVGLAIYLSLWMAAWMQIRAIRRGARGKPEFAWAYDLTTMLQVSLVAYMVAGAALSMAYYDILWIIFGILTSVRQLVSPRESTSRTLVRAVRPRPLVGAPLRR
ncbi:MAG: putative O-glycosylation ligase, exosortase A system-associated, partial [Alphaproteobacteria bacterium]|nr:putative O-glycosylation ligase, exosortase A system-associated [Alphaproteobacteria bacterium]